MSETSITRKTLEEAKKAPDLTDWDKVRSMSEEEIELNALSDPDNQILSPENLKNFRRINRKQNQQVYKGGIATIDKPNVADKKIKDFVENHYIAKLQNDSEKYLLLEIVDRYNSNCDLAAEAKELYEEINSFFSIVIPIYSATLTFILAGTFESIQVYLPFLGLGLTIFTISFFVLKPYERSKLASEMLISLINWKVAFVVGLDEHIEPAKTEATEALKSFLVAKNKELSKIEKSRTERFALTTYNSK